MFKTVVVALIWLVRGDLWIWKKYCIVIGHHPFVVDLQLAEQKSSGTCRGTWLASVNCCVSGMGLHSDLADLFQCDRVKNLVVQQQTPEQNSLHLPVLAQPSTACWKTKDSERRTALIQTAITFHYTSLGKLLIWLFSNHRLRRWVIFLLSH